MCSDTETFTSNTVFGSLQRYWLSYFLFSSFNLVAEFLLLWGCRTISKLMYDDFTVMYHLLSFSFMAHSWCVLLIPVRFCWRDKIILSSFLQVRIYLSICVCCERKTYAMLDPCTKCTLSNNPEERPTRLFLHIWLFLQFQLFRILLV